MFWAYSCDAITGDPIDRFKIRDCSWDRLLSAGGSGSVTIPLDGTFSRSALDYLLRAEQRIIVIERDGRVEYGGYAQPEQYTVGGSSTVVPLKDIWSLWATRGGWDRSHPYTPQWQTTVTGVRGHHAWEAVRRGRDTGLPTAKFPVTLVSVGGGSTVTRNVYGYLLEYIGDIISDLMNEGLDVYTKPRWLDGKFDWGFYAGMSWGSGQVREYPVSVAEPRVTDFAISGDSSRIATNAVRLGEGSEVDMLARSRSDDDSPYPVRDRITPVKTVNDPLQLDSMALADLAAYGEPTIQWDFKVRATEPIDVGDEVKLHLSGNPRIPDGWHTRRVVKVSGGVGEFLTIGVQPTGGA